MFLLLLCALPCPRSRAPRPGAPNSSRGWFTSAPRTRTWRQCRAPHAWSRGQSPGATGSSTGSCTRRPPRGGECHHRPGNPRPRQSSLVPSTTMMKTTRTGRKRSPAGGCPSTRKSEIPKIQRCHKATHGDVSYCHRDA